MLPQRQLPGRRYDEPTQRTALLRDTIRLTQETQDMGTSGREAGRERGASMLSCEGGSVACLLMCCCLAGWLVVVVLLSGRPHGQPGGAEAVARQGRRAGE